MSLPPALLARLKKRGIVKGRLEQAKQDDNADGGEEVFAESYDADDGHSHMPKSGSKAAGAPGCPNKCSAFHLCSSFCWSHWGDGVPEARVEHDYLRRKKRMLKKYPLPAGWKEVYEPGTGRYYYWNVDSDEVCWLSPTHRRAVIGDAAPRLAKAFFDKMNRSKIEALARATSYNASKKNKRNRSPSPPPSDNESDEEPQSRDRFKRPKHASRQPEKKRLDPMDPASYGDCAPGNWSSGLPQGDEAKTGVDATASGPLFQMRPYPSPGAILRKKKE